MRFVLCAHLHDLHLAAHDHVELVPRLAGVEELVAGGAGLGLKHGSHLDYNTKSKDFKGYTLDKPGEHYRLCHRPANTKGHLSNLLLTMAQKMDVKTDTFADSNGVISEVLT